MHKHSTRVILSQLSGEKIIEPVDRIKESVNPVPIETLTSNAPLSTLQSSLPVAEYGNALNYILGPTLSDEPSPMDK